ncbi:hypothetical protein A3C32_01560 [Candidatus Daviesbacteria bacterium RIFCSPHIGHO2_02_FULL_41_14]|uniref:Uncharacterized protein n=1 Tax=Candidatus Daviesbacteria bacterium RIFCSPLOWO2_01_FULL_40_24 TaxID=1797787 RepID=A0A1F5MIK7_9BACT|nr:MAG: hypothetical protein A3C32_01560 [Candidatus Daviesbacteria bacterium RIFCSPHIGHO2_02_FULL_41_14]OGE65217.1 MAG: hypothetical protein A3B49_00170 [Candidatus Daviesbacteria bacterium RIFCSPLOWO2_01_FULL_40_24]
MILLIIRLMEIGLVVNFPLGFIPFFRDRTKTNFTLYALIIGLLLLIVTSIDSFYVFPKIVKLYSDYKADPNLNLMITFFIVQFLISTLFVLIGIKSKKFTLKNRRNLYLIHILVTLALLTWLELTIQTVVIPVSRLVDLVR